MKFTLAIFLIGCLFISCKKKNESNDTLEIAKLKVSYANQLLDNSSELSSQLEILHNRITLYTTTYTVTHYNMSKAEWKTAKMRIDMLSPFQYLNEVDFNSFLINPAYIDATSYDNSSGIILNTAAYPTITIQTIQNANYIGSSPNNISKGIHALEFLLWGNDLNPTGPGDGGPNPFDPNSSANYLRRKAYLLGLITLLKNDLDEMNYSEFKDNVNAKDPKESLAYLLKGIHDFIRYDIAEKSIKKPIDLLDPLYEESQFSDNSTEDIKNKILSIRNYIYGSQFTATNGYFIADYMTEKSPDSAAKMLQLLNGLETTTQSFEFLFDVAIQNQNQREELLAVYNQLIELSNLIANFATERGVSI